MSILPVAFFLVGLIAGAGCRQDTASPPRESPLSETISERPTATSSTPPAPPSTTAVDTRPAGAPLSDSAKPKTSRSPAQSSIKSFAVYTLSRGKGVPPEAREALRRVVAIAEDDQRRGVTVTVTTTRIGIEGETRACIAYKDPMEGSRAYERSRAIVKGVDLVNLAVEPCGEPANNK